MDSAQCSRGRSDRPYSWSKTISLYREWLRSSLADGGFDVAIAASGEEAVALLKTKAASYRALVTDINLPDRIDGWEIARLAREMIATLPVVYMTGAAGDEWASKGVPESILLTKPFAPAQLVTAVSQLLNAGGPNL